MDSLSTRWQTDDEESMIGTTTGHSEAVKVNDELSEVVIYRAALLPHGNTHQLQSHLALQAVDQPQCQGDPLPAPDLDSAETRVELLPHPPTGEVLRRTDLGACPRRPSSPRVPVLLDRLPPSQRGDHPPPLHRCHGRKHCASHPPRDHSSGRDVQPIDRPPTAPCQGSILKEDRVGGGGG